MSHKSRTILSSKRARGAAKKSKKLLQLEAQLEQLAIVPLMFTPTMPVKPLETPVIEDERTDEEEEEEEEDVVVISNPFPRNICTRFVQKNLWTPRDIKKFASTPDATFSVSIPTFRDAHEGYVAYSVIIETPYHSWRVEKRYSEFVVLAQTLQLKEILFELPPKTWFKVTQDDALAERRERLEASCIDLLQRDGIPTIPCIREFFQLDMFAVSLTDPQ
ncbi:hypothetical protein THRCLA_01703 [Thraustotheca clavata]|uniref:PX domain-containing protein n=1 Tax=Thraustotheca clavata TaxID=74557 RepID=A0A1W0A7P2_9STRA|nr:hypothetical protein THRCLA_01703 [Thraustotheca clavata]